MTAAPADQLDQVRSSRRFVPVVTGLTPREAKWANSVRDLHRMMEVAKTVYVTLCHYDEPLLRVALEIVTCPAWAKIFQWDCNWFAQKQQHDMFSHLVKSMLNKVLSGGSAVVVDSDENDLGQQLAEARAEVDQQRALLEGQLAMANYELQSLRSRVGELEESLSKSASQCRRLSASAKARERELSGSGGDLVAGHERKIQELEEELRRARELLLAAEQTAAQQGKRLAPTSQTESKEMESCIAALNAELKKVRAEYDKLRREHAQCDKQPLASANAVSKVSVAQDTDPAPASTDNVVLRQGAEETSSRGVQVDLTSQEIARLQEENTKHKLALAELQHKLKSMMQEAKEEGIQDQFTKIALKAGLGTVMSSIGVFERLYLDAFERIERLDALRQKYRSVHKVDILEGANLVEVVTSASSLLDAPNLRRASKPATVEAGHKRRGVADPVNSLHPVGYISDAAHTHGEQQLDGRKRHHATVRGGLFGRTSRSRTQTGLQSSVSLPQLASATMGAEVRPLGQKRSAWRSRSSS
eukprot:TRINITY_DN108013_c0_g1_i1.p1 TRINITY_DN108013_c0_g1~~TRINITY_DN108013_c0_g1_i1.p1  ORF type:complete len:531 (+),score=102.50 TRINITY_DN108013_c0_g1_i1:87-1679(+)